MTKSNIALAQSIKSKITNLAREKKKSPQQLMTIFLLERAVARLVRNETLSKALIFKGGFVGVQVYESLRHTTDIDAIISKMSAQEAVEFIKDAMGVNLEDGTWFEYESTKELETQGSYKGIGVSFRAGIGGRPQNLKKAQLVSIDIGIGDSVTPSPRDLSTKLSIINDELSWRVYTVETIISEKIHALYERGQANSRSKDVFDINFLLPKANAETLKSALKATFEGRKTTLPDNLTQNLESIELDILKRGWQSATSGAATMSFEDTYSSMINKLKDFEL